MKKVLLTTTALVMTAGVAAAEVSFSGTSQVALSNTQSAGNVLTTHTDFNVAISGASDNGITFSSSFGYDSGRQVDVADTETDAEEAGTFGAGHSLTIGYGGITVTADGAGVADLYNGDVNSGDLGISGSMGGISFGLTTGLSAADDNSSMSLGYAMGDVAVSYASTNNSDNRGTDASKMSLSYTMGDMKITASSDDRDDTANAVQSVGVSYTMDAVGVSFSAANTGAAGSSIGDDWDVSVSYTAGALTASVSTDEDSVSRIAASYDMGGGVSAFFVNRAGSDNGGVGGAARDRDYNAVGINFAF
jgi:outer membrane protein OmpU